MRQLRSIGVFCGSSAGTDPAFGDAAREMGAILAANGVRLVYGGGAVGLMGMVADAALAGGGEVVGVIPAGLFEREVAHRGVTELVEVASMHERKQVMYERSDAFVVLPGGLGTLEELTEIATWVQLGLHAKPIVTLNVAGYWDRLHDFLRHAARSCFVKSASLDIIANVDRVEDVLPALRSQALPSPGARIDLPQT